jgi:3-oxoadipate enol-lactonase
VRGPRRPVALATDTAPVVLVHGLSLDSSMWNRQFEALSRYFVTYRYDMRGHGRSDAVTGPVALHEDLLGVMDALGIERAHLVGQSLGGNAATEVAATHPERVDTLTLIDSGINGFPYPTPNVLQRIPTYLDIFASDGRDAALRAWIQDPLFAVSRERRRLRRTLEGILLRCSCSLFFSPQLQVRPDTYSRLSQITAPTLLMIGELDTSEFQAATAALRQHISGATAVVIPDAGHMANMDEPVAVTRHLLHFLHRAAGRGDRGNPFRH